MGSATRAKLRIAGEACFLIGWAATFLILSWAGAINGFGDPPASFVSSFIGVAILVAIATLPAVGSLVLGLVFPNRWGTGVSKRGVVFIVMFTALAFLVLVMMPFHRVQFDVHEQWLTAIDEVVSRDVVASSAVEPQMMMVPQDLVSRLPYRRLQRRIKKCRDGTMIVTDKDMKSDTVHHAYLRVPNPSVALRPGMMVRYGRETYHVLHAFDAGWYFVEGSMARSRR